MSSIASKAVVASSIVAVIDARHVPHLAGALGGRRRCRSRHALRILALPRAAATVRRRAGAALGSAPVVAAGSAVVLDASQLVVVVAATAADLLLKARDFFQVLLLMTVGVGGNNGAAGEDGSGEKKRWERNFHFRYAFEVYAFLSFVFAIVAFLEMVGVAVTEVSKDGWILLLRQTRH